MESKGLLFKSLKRLGTRRARRELLREGRLTARRLRAALDPLERVVGSRFGECRRATRLAKRRVLC